MPSYARALPVNQAVIVAGGLGTRFLPATKTLPKEMLPVVDRPMVHYAVEEAVESGLSHVVLITAAGKSSLEDYFHPNPELERMLAERGETEKLDLVQGLVNAVDISYVRQKEPRGLGHAILSAERLTGGEPFVALLPDDIIAAEVPATRQMLDVYARYPGCHIAVERVAQEDIPSYGIIDPEPVEPRVYRVKGMVEKPPIERAPSNLGIVGRYILVPEIFDAIRRTPPGARGEIQITDAIDLLRREGCPVYVYEFEGTRYDAGTPLGHLKASVGLAMRRPEFGPALRDYLRGLLGEAER
ncbi:MAG: UTP--glucose-1-phosphate uridylyltransferase [Chloroflexi bacterium]|nr:UTP--glucose-1-phosphate uridylyltransferase [Chloroflexota bacterium]